MPHPSAPIFASNPAHPVPATAGQPHLARWHAGPPGAPRLSAAHRVLRLVIAAGTVATGLCLVLGLTALVAQISGGRMRTPALPAAAHRPVGRKTGRTGSGPPAPRLLVPGRVVASYRGAGVTTRAHFLIADPGTWGLAWSLACGGGRPGRLTVTGEFRPGLRVVQIVALSPAGHGIAWYTSDPGDHRMTITSGCSWSVRVVLPRPGARAPA